MRNVMMGTVLTGAIASGASASDFWHFDGVNDVSFTKSAFADTSNPVNWDSITVDVAITRGNTQGLFNPIVHSNYTGAGPAGTLWYFGATAQDVADGTVELEDFNDWQPAAGSSPPSTLGQDAVLYLIARDTYVDIKFTGWGIGSSSGGGFSYDRAVPAPGVLGVVGAAGLGMVRRRR